MKRVTRPMLGFKSFEAAKDTLVGIELVHDQEKADGRGGRGRGPNYGRIVLLSGRVIHLDRDHCPFMAP